MYRFSAPADVDLSLFAPDVADPETRYGLPSEIAFCESCVISNQRPNSSVEFRNRPDSKKSTINFNEDGVCDACKLADQKHNEIDWDVRRAELVELCDRYRRDDGRYDCLVPGSGGKDSFYAAHVLKHEFGMHPLTVTWSPHNYTDWGWRNMQRWIHAGFDNILHTPNGRVHRLLTRIALENLFHPFQPFILGQKNLAPAVAAQLDIPLVFYGENEAEYGNPVADMEKAERNRTYFASGDLSEIFLSGLPVQELIEDFGVEAYELQPYLPADPQILEDRAITVHYLGYYLKWHPQSCYYYSVDHGGFEASPERTPGTYSKYNSIDDKIDDLHYFTTFIKFGIGRATYDAAQEIRSRDIEREEGVALVNRFDGEYPDRFEDDNFAYLTMDKATLPEAHSRFEHPEMTREYLMRLADSFRPPHLWKHENGEWALRRAVWMQND